MSLTNISSILVLVGTMMGYGIIVLPVLFARVGYLGAIAMLTIGAILTITTVYLLFEASSASRANSKIGQKVSFFSILQSINPTVGDTCNIFITTYLFMANVTYQRHITQLGLSLLHQFSGKKYSGLVIALPLACIEFLLALLPDISALSKVSYLSMGACMFVGLICIRYSLLRPAGLEFVKFDSSGISKSIGGFIFALTGQTVIPDIYENLGSGTSTTFITFVGVILGVVLCFLMGFAGYFLGGSDLKKTENILEYLCKKDTPVRKSIENSSFDQKGYAITFATILFTALLTCSYALLHFTGKHCFFDTFNRHFTRINTEKAEYKKGLRMVSFCWIAATTIVSMYYYPESLLNINGTYIGNTIGFVFPTVAYISHCGKENRLLYFAAISVLCFGIGMMLFSTYDLYIK